MIKVTLLFCIFASLSCQSPTTNSEFIDDKTNNVSNSVSENVEPNSTSKNDKYSDPVDVKSIDSVLWNATIRYADLIDTNTELSLYSFDENQYDKPLNKESPYFKARGGIDVDLMNCGGYLASGRLTGSVDSTSSVPDWNLKISPETIAEDAEAKIKKCDANNYEGADITTKDPALSNAFAVTPSNKKRREIVIGDTDTKKVFASLPKVTKEWANSKVNIEYWKREKSNLTLGRDNWTDLDGDGKIDLVSIFAYTDEEHGSGAVLLLVKGKWKEIGSSQPA